MYFHFDFDTTVRPIAEVNIVKDSSAKSDFYARFFADVEKSLSFVII